MAREMRDSGIQWIGEIPSQWDVIKNKNIFIEVNELNTTEDGFPLLSVSEYYGVALKSEKIKDGEYETRAESIIGYKICKPKDLVFNIMLTWKRALGLSEYSGVVSPAYCVYRSKSSNIFPKYYHYLFRTDQCADEFKRYSTGIIDSRLRLYPDVFFALKTLIPPYTEQVRIASYLDSKCAEIDKAIEATKASIEEYRKLRQAIITEAVTKGLDPDVEMKDSRTGYLGTIPSKWGVKKLRFFGSCQNGISKGAESFGEKGYPFVSYSDVYKNINLPIPSEIVDSTQKERSLYSVEKGDIFFTRTSETIEEIGFSSVCLETIPDATFAGFLIRVRPINKELNEKYSSYYFRSDIHRRYFSKEMNLVTRASLGQTLLKNMPILIPPMDEQQKISDYLDTRCSEIDSLIKSKEKLIEELTAYRKSLIYEYVTGKKEVPIESA